MIQIEVRFPTVSIQTALNEVMLRCIVMCQENSKDVTYVVLVGWYTCG